MGKIYVSIIIFLFGLNYICQAKPFEQIFLKDTGEILIPFEFQQSTLYHPETYEVIDSIADLLLRENGITLTISGFAHADEGTDTICYYLSYNRAMFVRDYILGRGVKKDRILKIKANGKVKIRELEQDYNKHGLSVNQKVELKLNYPKPPPIKTIPDRDGDGIADVNDACPDVYGYEENNGCPDKDAILVPFKFGQTYLSTNTYVALDSIVAILKTNYSYKVVIEGHAFETEGIASVTNQLARDRSNIVKNYLFSRNINLNRIIAIKNWGINRPYNAGRDPREEIQNARAMVFIKK